LSRELPGEAPELLIEGPGPLLQLPSRPRRARFFGGIGGFVARRVLFGAITLFVASLIIFAATQALPGDAARSILGRNATPESLAALREQLGLNEPVVEQYTDWVGDLVMGDLGTSLTASRPVVDVIGERVGYSAFLMLLAAVVSIPLAIVLGAASARRRDGPFDHTVSVVTLALAALPEFIVGIALVIVFATTILHVFPAVTIIDPGTPPWSHPKELVLPTVTLIIAVTPYMVRIMRASMVEILESDYVEMARLKGLSERLVLWRHAVPNGIAPTFQVIAINLAYLAGGIVVVESVFNFPGIGAGFVDAVRSRDMPVVQALSLLIAALYVVLNLLADVATILVSPRLRTSLK
jgi:peptide/nickel transport system permease protein